MDSVPQKTYFVATVCLQVSLVKDGRSNGIYLISVEIKNVIFLAENSEC